MLVEEWETILSREHGCKSVVVEAHRGRFVNGTRFRVVGYFQLHSKRLQIVFSRTALTILIFSTAAVADITAFTLTGQSLEIKVSRAGNTLTICLSNGSEQRAEG